MMSTGNYEVLSSTFVKIPYADMANTCNGAPEMCKSLPICVQT